MLALFNIILAQTASDPTASAGMFGGVVGLLVVVERVVKLVRNGSGHEKQIIAKLDQMITQLAELNGRLAGRGD